MITEDDEFKRIESEIKRRAAQEPSMTDLRQAAQQALEAMETNQYTVAELAPHKVVMKFNDAITALREALAQDKLRGLENLLEESITALKAALEQPEQEPSQWRDMVVVSLVREGVNKHKARELADHFAAQRPWQGLTDEDWAKVGDMPDTFDQGVAWAQARLMERNT